MITPMCFNCGYELPFDTLMNSVRDSGSMSCTCEKGSWSPFLKVDRAEHDRRQVEFLRNSAAAVAVVSGFTDAGTDLPDELIGRMFSEAALRAGIAATQAAYDAFVDMMCSFSVEEGSATSPGDITEVFRLALQELRRTGRCDQMAI